MSAPHRAAAPKPPGAKGWPQLFERINESADSRSRALNDSRSQLTLRYHSEGAERFNRALTATARVPGSTPKSGKAHRHFAEQRRDPVGSPVLHVASPATGSAIRTKPPMLVGLTGNHRPSEDWSEAAWPRAGSSLRPRSPEDRPVGRSDGVPTRRVGVTLLGGLDRRIRLR